jgi:hypothetical protein
MSTLSTNTLIFHEPADFNLIHQISKFHLERIVYWSSKRTLAARIFGVNHTRIIWSYVARSKTSFIIFWISPFAVWGTCYFLGMALIFGSWSMYVSCIGTTIHMCA